MQKTLLSAWLIFALLFTPAQAANTSISNGEAGSSVRAKLNTNFQQFNVKQPPFNATGDGTTDDTTAIQSAITAACTAGLVAQGSRLGSEVFFPAGVYKTTAALTMCAGNASLALLGSGKWSSLIYGNFAGYIIDKPDDGLQNLERVEHLGVTNLRQNADAGGIRFNAAEKGIINDVKVSAFIGIEAVANTYVTRISNVELTSSATSGTSGSVGIFTAQVGVYNTRIQGYDYGIVASNAGLVLSDVAIEVTNTAVSLGRDRNLALSSVSGASIIGLQTERVNTCLEVLTASSVFVGGSLCTGTVGVPVAISTATWAGGTATITTARPHGITAGAHDCTVENVTPSGYNVTHATCTYSSTNTVTYSISNPGGSGSGADMTVSPLPQYGVRIRGATGVVFSGVGVSTTTEFAAWDLAVDGNTSGTNNIIEGATGSPWILPPGNSKASFRLNNSSNQSLGMLFADLPGQSGVYATTPIAGDEFFILNCTIAGSAWGGVVTNGGGGGVPCRVSYNGTNWTAAAK